MSKTCFSSAVNGQLVSAVKQTDETTSPAKDLGEGLINKAPAKSADQAHRTTQYFVELALVILVYFLGGKIGLAVPYTSGNVSPVWPPAGIAVAAMLMVGYRIWPAVAIGAFLVNFFTPIPPLAA